jgi:hypothetical protein
MSTLPINLPLTNYNSTISNSNVRLSNISASNFSSDGVTFTPNLFIGQPAGLVNPNINLPLTNYRVTPSSTPSSSTTFIQSDIDPINGLRCNGSSTKNLTFNGLTGAYSITFNIIVDSYNNGDWIFMQGNPNDTTNQTANVALGLRLHNNNFQLSISDLIYNSNNISTLSSPSTTPPSSSFLGSSNFITIVVNPIPSIPEVILYVNGVKYSTGPNLTFNKKNFILGGQGAYGKSFTGYIRNFLTYPISLNQSQISYLYGINNYSVICTNPPSLSSTKTPSPSATKTPSPSATPICVRSTTLPTAPARHSQYIRIANPTNIVSRCAYNSMPAFTITISFDILITSYNLYDSILLIGDIFESGELMGNQGVLLSILSDTQLTLALSDSIRNNTTGSATASVPNNARILNTPLRIRIKMTQQTGSLTVNLKGSNTATAVNISGGNSSCYCTNAILLGASLNPVTNSFGGTISNFQVTNGDNRSQFTSSIVPELEPFDNLLVKPNNRLVTYSKYYVFLGIAFYVITFISNVKYDRVIPDKNISFALNILLLICIYIALNN